MRNQLRRRPVVESLEPRTALSAAPVLGDLGGQVDPTLRAFADAYLSVRGDANFDPALDANHNGYIGQADARPVLRAAAPITPRITQTLAIHLAPDDQARGPYPKASGGVTRKMVATVIGLTTPNSIIFVDSPLTPTSGNAATRAQAGEYKFAGGALVSDSRGFFSYQIRLRDRLTQTEYLAFDPFGHQKIAAFPIVRLPR